MLAEPYAPISARLLSIALFYTVLSKGTISHFLGYVFTASKQYIRERLMQWWVGRRLSRPL
jgi:hypothetical protein